MTVFNMHQVLRDLPALHDGLEPWAACTDTSRESRPSTFTSTIGSAPGDREALDRVLPPVLVVATTVGSIPLPKAPPAPAIRPAAHRASHPFTPLTP